MGERPLVIGVTGSLGMGKTTVASQLAALGARTCDADAIVHRLLARGGAAVAAVGEAFPEALKDGAIDRQTLGALVFADNDKLAHLERILHPPVVEEENKFIEAVGRDGGKIAVLEIPLLFETGAESRCDAVLVVTAPGFIQKRRAMKRPGMTKEKFARIVEKQMSDAEKRRRADYIVQTGFGRAYSMWQVKNILNELKAKSRHAA